MKREAVLDLVGRVCIPKPYLKSLGWNISTKSVSEKVNLELLDDSIIITKQDYKVCDGCGKNIKSSWKYCPECGKKVGK